MGLYIIYVKKGNLFGLPSRWWVGQRILVERIHFKAYVFELMQILREKAMSQQIHSTPPSAPNRFEFGRKKADSYIGTILCSYPVITQ